MKKYFIRCAMCAIPIVLGCTPGYAITDCCGGCPPVVSEDLGTHIACSTPMRCNMGTCTCEPVGTQFCNCMNGYYGDPNDGCKPCPENTYICVYTSFTCAAGYYKTSTECKECPSPGTSDNNNSNGITDCYIPAGTTGSDSTGSFIYVSDCHYSN